MGEVNKNLRRTFTAFNVLFAIAGLLIIGLAFVHQVLTNFHAGDNVRTGIYGLYIIGTGTMVIATLGAYGAHKKSKLCLSLFLGCMVTGTLMMLNYGIPAAISRHQVEELIENDLRAMVPLDDQPEELKSMMDSIQIQAQCCGLFSYDNWRNIPESCMCSPEAEDRCQSVSYRQLLFVYPKTCLPFIMERFRLIVDILIGTIFTLAALAMLGTILSSVMIHQMSRLTAPTPVFKVPLPFNVPSIFIPATPKYEELSKDPPAYF
ncbi:tetraspanin-3-like [Betta splendens]|uniref:Tetraspanin n=1 Tax=Betta splendens TaxID=158456 RepID=A0A6P7NGR0_BETSP|nr:tetraspanin-3-like [Betta splendens]